jgi:DNA (cytosine-5)-methyltransferase 1
VSAYYNEFEPYAAQWIRNLIKAGLIPDGEVDERSIRDVSPDDLRGFTQCHFFAGLAGWGCALRIAGWPDGREIWTGSPPCQPFSVAGKRAGTADDRHLWPDLFRLIRSRRPVVLMGEQVSAAIGMGWVDGVRLDLEGEGYAARFASVPACAVNAPHRRDRLWFVADRAEQSEREPQHANGTESRQDAWANAGGLGGFDGGASLGDASREGLPLPQRETFCRTWRGQEGGSTGESSGSPSHVPDAYSTGRRPSESAGHVVDGNDAGREEKTGRPRSSGEINFWHDSEWINGADGKARRVKSRVCGVVDGLPEGVAGLRTIDLLAKNVPARVGKLRALGNAIVPQVAAEVIKAYMDVRP